MNKYKDIIKLETISSTNKYAIDLLKSDDLPEYTTFLTFNQTDGKGQKNNSWESEPHKNFTFSIVLHPLHLVAHDQFIISQAVSLGIVDFLEKHAISAKIKWPNDIYVGNKKICGILIENTLQGSSIKNSVIGIGLNINQSVFLSDAPNPTSVYLETEKNLELDKEIVVLIENIKVRYKQTRELHNTIKKDYLRKLYRFGEVHTFLDTNANKFEGRITGIGEGGRLEIESDNILKSFAFKEVEFII